MKKQEGEEEGQEQAHTHKEEGNPWQNQTHSVKSPTKIKPTHGKTKPTHLLPSLSTHQQNSLLQNKTRVLKTQVPRVQTIHSTSTRASKSSVLDSSYSIKLEFKKLEMLVC